MELHIQACLGCDLVNYKASLIQWICYNALFCNNKNITCKQGTQNLCFHQTLLNYSITSPCFSQWWSCRICHVVCSGPTNVSEEHIVMQLSNDKWVLDWGLDLLDSFTGLDNTLQITITQRLMLSVMLLGSSFNSGVSFTSGLIFSQLGDHPMSTSHSDWWLQLIYLLQQLPPRLNYLTASA